MHAARACTNSVTALPSSARKRSLDSEGNALACLLVCRDWNENKFYPPIIYYEIGVIICAALGLLFIILMPLVGFFFCLCRCCNKCGGEMHQRQKRSGPFLKKYFTISLLVICVFMSIGIIYGFAANQYMRTHVEETRKLSDSNFNDLRTLLNAVPGQIDYVLDQYTHTKEKAFDDLDNINSLLGGSIYERLKPKVLPVLKDIKALAEDMKTNRATLVQLNTLLTDMKQSSAHLRTSLRDMKTSMEQTLTDPQCSFPVTATTCASIRQSLSVLDGSANFDQLPSLDGHIAQLDGLLQTDLSGLVQKANDSLSDIPGEVENQTRDFISEFKKTLNSIQSDVKNVSTKIPIQKTLSNFVRYINNSEDYILYYLPTVEKCNSYRWLVCLTICCLLTLILIFYLLGLLCGTLGYDQNATPTNRGCVSNTGGVLLMVGVGFSFFFSWIVMSIVVLTFVTGGNLENLVCEPYRNKKFFQILDTPYLLNEDWEYYLSGLVFNKPDINLTFEQVYSDCKENKGLYATLKLDHIYNVSEELNITKHTGDINSNLENMNLRINDIELLDKTGRETLMDISSSGIDKIDYAAYINATERSPTRVNLMSFASNLQRKASQLPPGNLKISLKDHVDTLRNIHQNQVVPLQNSMRMRFQCSHLLFYLFLSVCQGNQLPESACSALKKLILLWFLPYIDVNQPWIYMYLTRDLNQGFASCSPWMPPSLLLDVFSFSVLGSCYKSTCRLSEVLGFAVILNKIKFQLSTHFKHQTGFPFTQALPTLGVFPGPPSRTADPHVLARPPPRLPLLLALGILASSTVSPLLNHKLLTVGAICSCGLSTPRAALNLRLTCRWCICGFGA
ncbi:hypothetical protein FD754_019083 [Muntiacus muntjak]|uniref:Prominin-1 n=1 Tax=Muntiacus muntjak TaxID=9888 RepID=A0A5N3UZC6_MUNMU|nr:hypothetical protein FD754_019083 [Muntiacus muntjak]